VSQCRFAEEMADDAYYKAKPKSLPFWIQFPKGESPFWRTADGRCGPNFIITYSTEKINRQSAQTFAPTFSQNDEKIFSKNY
jgi:alanyl-tRNA synthetase